MPEAVEPGFLLADEIVALFYESGEAPELALERLDPALLMVVTPFLANELAPLLDELRRPRRLVR